MNLTGGSACPAFASNANGKLANRSAGISARKACAARSVGSRSALIAGKDARAPSAHALWTVRLALQSAIAIAKTIMVSARLWRFRDRFISALNLNLQMRAYRQNKKGSSVIEHILLVLKHSQSSWVSLNRQCWARPLSQAVLTRTLTEESKVLCRKLTQIRKHRRQQIRRQTVPCG